MRIILPLFFDKSPSLLQVTRIAIKSCKGSKFGKSAGLVILERQEKHMFTIGDSFDHSSSFIFNLIFFILAGNKENYKISKGFEMQQDSAMDCGKIPIDTLLKKCCENYIAFVLG